MTSVIYDGDGSRVKSVMGTETTLFIGGHYEVTNPGAGQTVTKYYFAGATRVAMKKTVIPQSETLTYLLGDHLGSTSLAVDASDTDFSDVVETRYKPWGEVRFTTLNKTLPTRYTYTGQYSHVSDDATDLGSASFGLLFYNARWYDPYLNHFTQPDTIVPNLYYPQDWNRYSYARYNPLKYTDPTGHKVTCDVDEDCKQSQRLSRLTGMRYWKTLIIEDFGVSLNDDGAVHPHFTNSHGRAWNEKNALLIYLGLSQMNSALGGHLKTIIGSAVFTLNSHPSVGSYFGYTTYPNSSNVVDFYITTTIPLQNLFHEFGHVLDNSTGDAFTTSLGDSVHSSDDGTFWFGGDGVDVLDPSILLKSASVDDPYFGSNSIPALQHNDGTKGEQWADIWANYAAGNIDLSQAAGQALNKWITTQLGPYVSTP